MRLYVDGKVWEVAESNEHLKVYVLRRKESEGRTIYRALKHADAVGREVPDAEG